MIKNLLKNRKKRFSFYGILTLIIAVFFGGSYAATISQMSSNGIKGFDIINYVASNIFINLNPITFIGELFSSAVARSAFLGGFFQRGAIIVG